MGKYYSNLSPKEFWLSINFQEVKEYIKNKIKDLNLEVKIDNTILMLEIKGGDFAVVISANGLTNIVYTENTTGLKSKVQDIVLQAFKEQVPDFEFVE